MKHFQENFKTICVYSAGNEEKAKWKLQYHDHPLSLMVCAVNSDNTIENYTNLPTETRIQQFICASGDVKINNQIESGTSFAAPRVSAACAMLLNAGLEPYEAVETLKKLADKFDGQGNLLYNFVYGVGILNSKRIQHFCKKAEEKGLPAARAYVKEKAKYDYERLRYLDYNENSEEMKRHFSYATKFEQCFLQRKPLDHVYDLSKGETFFEQEKIEPWESLKNHPLLYSWKESVFPWIERFQLRHAKKSQNFWQHRNSKGQNKKRKNNIRPTNEWE